METKETKTLWEKGKEYIGPILVFGFGYGLGTYIGYKCGKFMGYNITMEGIKKIAPEEYNTIIKLIDEGIRNMQ